MPIPLLSVVIFLCVVGLLLWAVQKIPMDPTIAIVIRVVVIVAVGLYLLSLLATLGGISFPRFR